MTDYETMPLRTRSARRRSAPLWVVFAAGAVGLVAGFGAGSASTPAGPSARASGPAVGQAVGAPGAPVPTTAAAATTTTVFATTTSPLKTTTVAATTKPASAAVTLPGDGTYLVGTDIKPGLYKTSGPAPGGAGNCYWERDKDLDGTIDSIADNGNTAGQATVKVAVTDKAFTTSGCADWTKVG